MNIGITDTLKPNLTFYTNWLKRVEPAVDFTVLSHVRQNIEMVDAIDGLMLTGGGDVDPRYFGVKDSLSRAKGVSASRDEFEFYVIERAMERNIPMLGICRGMQTMNVYLGGSLILDLPSAGYEDHARQTDYQLAHDVSIEPRSLLHEIAGRDRLTVNSSHHQAVERLGNGLMAGANSSDGVTEAAEWVVKDRMPFLLLIQWHPERMEKEFESPASRGLAERFIKEVMNEENVKLSTRAPHLQEE